MISIVVPVLNEEKILPAFLDAAKRWPVTEVAIVDGGSEDSTPAILQTWSEAAKGEGAKRRFLTAGRGRGNQMNRGAEVAAASPILFFLHADSILPDPPEAAFEAIATTLQCRHVVGGAFHLQIHPSSPFLKVVSAMANLRSSLLGLPYGDQGIFVRQEVFVRMGGFRNWPLLEDLDFIQRLKREGKIVLLKQRITTSARRWEQTGLLATSLQNIFLLALYFMGVAPDKIGGGSRVSRKTR